MSDDFDLFVIGGGSGGVRCARIAAGQGAQVGIVFATGRAANTARLGLKRVGIRTNEHRQVDGTAATGPMSCRNAA